MTALSVVSETLGSGSDRFVPFSWAQYKKARTKDELINEADRGADFALVCWNEDGSMKVSVFQAKKGQNLPEEDEKPVKGIWKLNVHRRAKKPQDGVWRQAQMVQLSRTARLFQHAVEQFAQVRDAEIAVTNAKELLSSATKDDLKETVKQTSWIQYIAYFHEEVVTVAISKLIDQLDREFDDEQFRTNLVTITQEHDPQPFAEVLSNGFTENHGDRWIVVEEALGRSLLPVLVDLMPTFVGGSGEHPTLSFEETVKLASAINFPASSATQQEAFLDLARAMPKPRNPAP